VQVWANGGQIHLLLNTLRKTPPVREASSTGLKLLATRETYVANLVTEGLPNREVALRLGISEQTVSNYLFRIYNKLGISSRVELAL
jgi:DNA-binding NarL/FixJ family response regulator